MIRVLSPRTALLASLLSLGAVLAPLAASAGVPSAPMYWAKGSVATNDQAVEHLTIRARNPAGQDTFIRVQAANAGFKHGQLKIAFRQEAPGGTFYADQSFDVGDYTVMGDHFGVTAGKHRIEVSGGQLVLHLDFGSLKVEATLSSLAAPLQVVDRNGSGFIARELFAPVGRLTLQVSDAGGRTFSSTSTAFAVHEASTATAHKVYDRAIQLHHLGADVVLTDYIVTPAERGARPLGFVVIWGKGHNYVGEVTSETRADEHADGANGYKVPYQVTVASKRGDARAAVRMTAEKQVERDDDLADLNFVARKAAAMFMHPVTYTLRGKVAAEVRPSATAPVAACEANAKFKYAQVR